MLTRCWGFSMHGAYRGHDAWWCVGVSRREQLPTTCRRLSPRPGAVHTSFL
jgi:hypothetical protein